MCRFFQFVCVCTLPPILLCKQQQEGESTMAARKVELCGMDTSQLPVLSEAEKSKRAGTLSNEEIDGFYEQFSPLLDNAKRRQLKSVVERLKRI